MKCVGTNWMKKWRKISDDSRSLLRVEKSFSENWRKFSEWQREKKPRKSGNGKKERKRFKSRRDHNIINISSGHFARKDKKSFSCIDGSAIVLFLSLRFRGPHKRTINLAILTGHLSEVEMCSYGLKVISRSFPLWHSKSQCKICFILPSHPSRSITWSKFSHLPEAKKLS